MAPDVPPSFYENRRPASSEFLDTCRKALREKEIERQKVSVTGSHVPGHRTAACGRRGQSPLTVGALAPRTTLEGAAPAVRSSWPLRRPPDWLQIVSQRQSEPELQALRHCVSRGRLASVDGFRKTRIAGRGEPGRSAQSKAAPGLPGAARVYGRVCGASRSPFPASTPDVAQRPNDSHARLTLFRLAGDAALLRSLHRRFDRAID